MGKPATLRLASKVASLDPQKAEITLESGEVVSGDLILGADGVHVCLVMHILFHSADNL